MNLRNQSDETRIKETNEIINACYQNKNDISDCFQKLNFSDQSTKDQLNSSSEDESFYENYEKTNLNPTKSGASFFIKRDFSYYPIGTAKAIGYKQGRLGDCWLIAALNAFNPNYLRTELVIKKKRNVDMYEICLFVRGSPKLIEVDAVFPVDLYGNLIYASCANQTYACLIEKAFAKINGGNYQSLAAGLLEECNIFLIVL